MLTVVGGIINKDNKILLVQEAKEMCHGMWNLPAGKLEQNEYLLDEIKSVKNEIRNFELLYPAMEKSLITI